jgi:periplasmic divalent cation tolerance protein
MIKGRQNRIVLVTCATLKEARRIARAVVAKRLAACVNLFASPVESFYIWNRKLEKAREFLLVMKTAKKRLVALEKEVKRLHSYEVPEFIVLPVVAGSREYLSWLQESVAKGRIVSKSKR